MMLALLLLFVAPRAGPQYPEVTSDRLGSVLTLLMESSLAIDASPACNSRHP